MNINESIFITNTFAKAFPQVHLELWKKFEQEVPFMNRSGHYGAENEAYAKFLKTSNHPAVREFFSSHIAGFER